MVTGAMTRQMTSSEVQTEARQLCNDPHRYRHQPSIDLRGCDSPLRPRF